MEGKSHHLIQALDELKTNGSFNLKAFQRKLQAAQPVPTVPAVVNRIPVATSTLSVSSFPSYGKPSVPPALYSVNLNLSAHAPGLHH